MAKAYKCDICDKLYINPTEYEEKTDPVNGVACGFIPTNIQFSNEVEGVRTASHDVCPDCMRFFREVIPVIRYYGGTKWMVWPK